MTPTWRFATVTMSLTLAVATTAIHVTAQQGRTPAPQVRTPVFRSGTAVVTASVSVKKGNRPVTGLKPEDFNLTDNGVKQVVDRITFEDVPIDVTVVIDLSGSTAGVVDQIRKDTKRIIEFLRPIDRIRVVSIDTFVHEVLPLQFATKNLSLPERTISGGGSSIWDAIAVALIRRTDPERRQLVVAITDGDDTKSVVEAGTILDLARHSDTVLHVTFVEPPGIGFGGGPGFGGGFGGGPTMPGAGGGGMGMALGPPAGGFMKRRTTVPEWDDLLEATVLTGGDFHGAKKGTVRASEADAVGVFRRVFDDFRQSYVLQFIPEDVTSTGWHELAVKVKGVDDKGIRARKGYFAGQS